MTVADALAACAARLATAGIDTPRLDAQLLLAWVVRARREDLAREPDRALTAREETIFSKACALRSARRPLPYITGEAWFYGRRFKVNRAVLIPRPETELLVDLVLDYAAQHPCRTLRVADIGTGSGCVAVSIVCELPGAKVVATDVSALALRIADKNRVAHGVHGRVELRLGNLCEPFAAGERFDLIVSNPPYVDRDDAPTLMPEVRDYEPDLALYGGPLHAVDTPNPRTLRAALIGQARGNLRAGGILAVEIGAGQALAAAQDFASAGYSEAQVIADGSGIDRVVVAAFG